MIQLEPSEIEEIQQEMKEQAEEFRKRMKEKGKKKE